jgi:hypothetical protein
MSDVSVKNLQADVFTLIAAGTQLTHSEPSDQLNQAIAHLNDAAAQLDLHLAAQTTKAEKQDEADTNATIAGLEAEIARLREAGKPTAVGPDPEPQPREKPLPPQPEYNPNLPFSGTAEQKVDPDALAAEQALASQREGAEKRGHDGVHPEAG